VYEIFLFFFFFFFLIFFNFSCGLLCCPLPFCVIWLCNRSLLCLSPRLLSQATASILVSAYTQPASFTHPPPCKPQLPFTPPRPLTSRPLYHKREHKLNGVAMYMIIGVCVCVCHTSLSLSLSLPFSLLFLGI
jgi:hypothetical protein